MNKKSRDGLVQDTTEKFFMGFKVAAREIIAQAKIRDEEVVSEAELLAAIHYVSVLAASRVLGLGENPEQLLSQIDFLTIKTTQARIKMGMKKLREDINEVQN